MQFTIQLGKANNKLSETWCRAYLLSYLRSSLKGGIPDRLWFEWNGNEYIKKDLPATKEVIESLLPIETILNIDVGRAEINTEILPYGWAIMGLVVGYLRDCGLEESDTMKHDTENLEERLKLWFSNDWATDLETTWYLTAKTIDDHQAAFETIFELPKIPTRDQSAKWNIGVSWLPKDHPVYQFALQMYQPLLDKWLEEPDLPLLKSSGENLVVHCPHCQRKTWATTHYRFDRYRRRLVGATTLCCGKFVEKENWNG